ncbi:hypothetical protein [Streptococcus sciuri]|uniref:Uncharacterized protein n=1 Tax=Streptococcus sciuri TaxID=2973939 RepID=A0ABT2F788_9STRE|nr:hypothetical protein [Streptococcus sciuri]MCS4488356.1 hypothetical protein [Streptococcus sciuri]
MVKNIDTIKTTLKKIQDSYDDITSVKETLESKENHDLETASINYKNT